MGQLLARPFWTLRGELQTVGQAVSCQPSYSWPIKGRNGTDNTQQHGQKGSAVVSSPFANPPAPPAPRQNATTVGTCTYDDLGRRLKIHTTQWANRGSVLFVATHAHTPCVRALSSRAWIGSSRGQQSLQKSRPFAQEHTPITWSTKTLLFTCSERIRGRLTGSTPPWQTVARIVEGFNSAH
jgi:hypothetical protein